LGSLTSHYKMSIHAESCVIESKASKDRWVGGSFMKLTDIVMQVLVMVIIPVTRNMFRKAVPNA